MAGDIILLYLLHPQVQDSTRLVGAPLDRGFDRVQLGEEHERRRRLRRPLRADHEHRLTLLVQHPQQKQGTGRVHRGHQQVGEVEHFGGGVLPDRRAPPAMAGKEKGRDGSSGTRENAGLFSSTARG